MRRILKSRRGNTIIEVMIALGVLAVLGLIMTEVIRNVMKDLQQRQLTSTRDQVALWVRQSAGSVRGLQNSLKQTGNEAFYTCVCGGGCNSAQLLKFTLYDLPTSPVTPIPTYYNAAGLPCDPNASNCYIRVTINFSAQCWPPIPSNTPVPPASCVQAAEFVAVYYKIDQNPVTIVPNSQVIPLKPITGSVFTQVASLNPPGSGICP